MSTEKQEETGCGFEETCKMETTQLSKEKQEELTKHALEGLDDLL